MFRWLTNLLTGQKQKQTEIDRLKQQIDSDLNECKRRAAAGDVKAAQKLLDFDETISAQSMRLIRQRAHPAK